MFYCSCFITGPVKNATHHALEITLLIAMFVILHILLLAPIKNVAIYFVVTLRFTECFIVHVF